MTSTQYSQSSSASLSLSKSAVSQPAIYLTSRQWPIYECLLTILSQPQQLRRAQLLRKKSQDMQAAPLYLEKQGCSEAGLILAASISQGVQVPRSAHMELLFQSQSSRCMQGPSWAQKCHILQQSIAYLMGLFGSLSSQFCLRWMVMERGQSPAKKQGSWQKVSKWMFYRLRLFSISSQPMVQASLMVFHMSLKKV